MKHVLFHLKAKLPHTLTPPRFEPHMDHGSPTPLYPLIPTNPHMWTLLGADNTPRGEPKIHQSTTKILVKEHVVTQCSMHPGSQEIVQ